MLLHITYITHKTRNSQSCNI